MAVSRYKNTQVLDKRFYGTSEFPSQQKLNGVPTISVRLAERDRLDILAFKHLGSGEYWWIIALMNNIDWMYGFEAGTVIKIPIDVNDVLNLI